MRPDIRAKPSVDVRRIATEPAQFENLYRQSIESVQNFISRRVSDPYLVADLTADVFLTAIDAATSYQPTLGTPTGWLLGIARKVVAAEYRRGARAEHATDRLAGRRLVDEDDFARLEQRIDSQRAAAVLYRSMHLLSDGERAVLELVALDELTVAQAAQILGISGVAARVRLHRARRLLRAHLVAAAPAQRTGKPTYLEGVKP